MMILQTGSRAMGMMQQGKAYGRRCRNADSAQEPATFGSCIQAEQSLKGCRGGGVSTGY
jgi:hypothetical protein